MAKHAESSSHDYICRRCGFASIGHSTVEARDERGAQHETEHETGRPAPELAIAEGGAA